MKCKRKYVSPREYRIFIFLAAMAVLVAVSVSQAEGKKEMSENDRINYSVGYQIGGDFRRQSVAVNPEALVQGVLDALGGAKPSLSRTEMQSALVELKNRIVARDKEQQGANAGKYRRQGKDFLAANARQEGVVTLPSGLQYKVLREGKGRKPGISDAVTVHYSGTLIDGTLFDRSSHEGKQEVPTTIALSDTIPAWREALPLMQEGAEWQLYVPADLAFGESGPLADRTVIYTIALLSVATAR